MSEPDAKTSNIDLPDWYPEWARQVADLYFSWSSCFFILHCNVNDLVPCEGRNGPEFLSLTSFLGEYLFGRWDIVLQHNLSNGLQALAGQDQ